MKNRFRSTAQTVDSWAILGIFGWVCCIAGAFLYWYGVIESTPYSLVSGLLAIDVLPLADWVLGGGFWLLVAALWMEAVRFRVAVLEAGTEKKR